MIPVGAPKLASMAAGAPWNQPMSVVLLLVLAGAAWSPSAVCPVGASVQRATSGAPSFAMKAAAKSVLCPLDFSPTTLSDSLAACGAQCSDGTCCYLLTTSVLQAQAAYSNATDILSLTVPQANACLQALNDTFTSKGLAAQNLLAACNIQESDFTNPGCPSTVKELQNKTGAVTMETVFNQCSRFATATSLFFPNESSNKNIACQGCQLALLQATREAAPNVTAGAMCTNPLLIHTLGSNPLWVDTIYCTKSISLVRDVDASVCPLAINSLDWVALRAACQHTVSPTCVAPGGAAANCMLCTTEIVRQVAARAEADSTVSSVAFPSLLENCMVPILASFVRYEPVSNAFSYPAFIQECSYTVPNSTAVATCPISKVAELPGEAVAAVAARCSNVTAAAACATCVPAVFQTFLGIPGLDIADPQMLQACGAPFAAYLAALPDPPNLSPCFPLLQPYASARPSAAVDGLLNRLLPAVFQVPAFALGPSPAPAGTPAALGGAPPPSPAAPAMAPAPTSKGAIQGLPPGAGAGVALALLLAAFGVAIA